MAMAYDEVIQEQVEDAPRNKNWRQLVGAMKDYLGKLRNIASNRAENAQESANSIAAEMKAYKKAIKKQRRYGTRTGIVIKS